MALKSCEEDADETDPEAPGTPAPLTDTGFGFAISIPPLTG